MNFGSVLWVTVNFPFFKNTCPDLPKKQINTSPIYKLEQKVQIRCPHGLTNSFFPYGLKTYYSKGKLIFVKPEYDWETGF